MSDELEAVRAENDRLVAQIKTLTRVVASLATMVGGKIEVRGEELIAAEDACLFRIRVEPVIRRDGAVDLHISTIPTTADDRMALHRDRAEAPKREAARG